MVPSVVQKLTALFLLALLLTACPSAGSGGGLVDGPGDSSSGGGLVDGPGDGSSGGGPTPAPRDGRRIGYDVLDITESGEFHDNMTQALDMEMEFLNLHLWWNKIETGGGVFVDPGDALGSLDYVANHYGIKLSLIISPVDIPGRATPADLSGTKFDDVAMATRFKALLDFVITKVSPANLLSISVGNEIDAYNWSANGDTPQEYTTFLQNIADHPVFTTHGVNLAFTATVHGLNNSLTPAVWTEMRAAVDVLHVTYYLMEDDFSFNVREPDSIYQDFADLVTNFEGPIFIQEVGYQSSAENNSSEEKQAQFFREFFSAWDNHRARIPQASILRFVDVSLASAQDTATTYGFTAGPERDGFIEYIRTLGIRTWEGTGTDKQAVIAIKAALEARGW